MPKSTFSIPQRIAIKYRQFIYRNRSSEPYLSGDAFANLADLVISSERDLQVFSTLSSIPRVTFCRSDLVTQLENKNFNHSQDRILIAGNGDFDFTDSSLLPRNIFQTFYLQNSSMSDNKTIFTLPIGVENLSLGINGLTKNLHSTRNWKSRSANVMVGPFSPTHKARGELLAQAHSNKDTFKIMESLISPQKFALLMMRFRYVACPRGNGLDTHRFWEALYRGSVPIVKRDEWSKSLKVLDIPFIEVDDWDQVPEAIRSFDENFLGFEPQKVESLWINYWKKRLSTN
jgi:hypothetical protein